MLPEFLLEPEPTSFIDSGYSGTSIPSLPFYTFDGGSSIGSSNPPIDGGNAVYVPVRGS